MTKDLALPRKLPLVFADEAFKDEQPDFCWPENHKFLDNVKMKTLQINFSNSIGNQPLTLVKATLTDDSESDTITSLAGNHDKKYTPTIEGKDIKRIAYAIYDKKITGLHLKKRNGQSMYIYSPSGYNTTDGDTAVYESVLEDNEEIVGIYGIAKKAQWISALGFIVRTKPGE